MPAGMAWGEYVRFIIASLFAMFAGAQTVHTIYKPLEDLDEYKEAELAKLQSATSNQPTTK